MNGKFNKWNQETKKILRTIHGGMVWLGMVFSFAGCGMQDAALVIRAGEETVFSEVSLKETTPEETAPGTVPSGTVLQEVDFPETNLISVYVCGAVVSPGVVELPEGSRAADALQAAGGFAEDAEISYVNLAAKVKDGEKLYFPNVTEDMGSLMQEKEQGLVNINTADVEELCSLPGIGEAKAQDIIAYREANGLFADKEDIMKVSGIKENAYAKICEKITVQ